jgi:A/G-specific adenine glycosylase
MKHLDSLQSDFAFKVVHWQRLAGRHKLAWQNTRDPYRIWVSEIMLQQTQVATVTPYYERFIKRFPDVHSLAQASLDEVLALWSGLGYYRRAKFLHACAKTIVETHEGAFPQDEKVLAELPGIGRSTAAAIAAFAFQRRAAILDGNVKRVLARVFALELDPQSSKSLRVFWDLAESLLPQDVDMPAYTQGLMDLGATCCLQRKPICTQCPLQDMCQAKQAGKQEAYPLARAKKTLPLRHWLMVWISDGERFLLLRRPAQGIWASMWSLPSIDVLPDTLIKSITKSKSESLPTPFNNKELLVAMHQLWRDQYHVYINQETLSAQSAAVLHASFKPKVKLEYALNLEQSFTHFRLVAPILHVFVDRESISNKADRAEEPSLAYALNSATLGQQQSLWLRMDEALELGIPRAIRKLLEDAK